MTAMIALRLLPHSQTMKYGLRATRYMMLQSRRVLDRISQLHKRPVGGAGGAHHQDLQARLERAPHDGAHRRPIVQLKAAPWPWRRLGTIWFQALAVWAITGRDAATEVLAEHRRREVALALVHAPDDVVIPHHGDLRHHLTLRALRLVRRQAFQTRGLAKGATVMVSVGQKTTMDFAPTKRQRDDGGRSRGSRSGFDRHCYGHATQWYVVWTERGVSLGAVMAQKAALTGTIWMLFARGCSIRVADERHRRYWADMPDFTDGPDAFARLRPHTAVTFEPIKTAHGWRAKNVRLAADDALMTTPTLAPEGSAA